MAKKNPKFRIGQMVWFIANGYVSNATVKSIFINKWNDIAYTVTTLKLEAGIYTVGIEDVKYGIELHPSKESLIKHIKEQEDEEDE